MSKTTSVYARVEPDIKSQAEEVLDQLGIPMSNAIGMFLRQVIFKRSIPFEMVLPQRNPVAMGALSQEEFEVEIQKGLDSLNAGQRIPSELVHRELVEKYCQ